MMLWQAVIFYTHECSDYIYIPAILIDKKGSVLQERRGHMSPLAQGPCHNKAIGYSVQCSEPQTKD